MKQNTLEKQKIFITENHSTERPKGKKRLSKEDMLFINSISGMFKLEEGKTSQDIDNALKNYF